MQSKATSVPQYLDELPEDRKGPMQQLREAILKNLDPSFEETMTYGMIGYVVPHSIYPDGYHVDPKQPLPFISIASQKNFIALYHSGIYSDPELSQWFQQEYAQRVTTKLDMGKSCIRFKNVRKIPYDLIEELCAKMSAQEWIELYEKKLEQAGKK